MRNNRQCVLLMYLWKKNIYDRLSQLRLRNVGEQRVFRETKIFVLGMKIRRVNIVIHKQSYIKQVCVYKWKQQLINQTDS